tara:strand:- start:10 stop:276 length:267 start_codon:yes stop_codon:yes gene_type:complete
MKQERNMTNIYNQTYEVELSEFQDGLVDLQNLLIDLYQIKDEIWRHHPSNEDFVNPIKEFDSISSQIESLEKRISELELKILHLKSAN